MGAHLGVISLFAVALTLFTGTAWSKTPTTKAAGRTMGMQVQALTARIATDKATSTIMAL